MRSLRAAGQGIEISIFRARRHQGSDSRACGLLGIVTDFSGHATDALPTSIFRAPEMHIPIPRIATRLYSSSLQNQSLARVGMVSLWRRSQVDKASPNSAHLSIARLADLAVQVAVITQNVNDFHQRAGSLDVVHLQPTTVMPCSKLAL